MPNPFFHFKQFTVYHDKCAMKIGTDGVLLGAWVKVKNKENILDVGTGTGIIAIMAAQRSNALIDAVEIDENACMQASENIASCPWHERIHLEHMSFQDFAKQCKKKYDLIVSNPPFFKNQYRPSEKSRSIARHDDALPLEQLVSDASGLLNPDGSMALIIPSELLSCCEKYLSDKALFITRKLNVMPAPEKPVKRILLEAERSARKVSEDYLAIEKGPRHDYTEMYKELTRDFYLAF
ncbi:MAG: methyltransferase [Bacteroidales bacterium]|nr:methyltransferase [Bacteroidales bacterium]